MTNIDFLLNLYDEIKVKNQNVYVIPSFDAKTIQYNYTIIYIEHADIIHAYIWQPRSLQNVCNWV